VFRAAVIAISCAFAPSVLAAERPRLGVLVVVDQLSVDAFDARVPKLTGGIKRMITEGVRFREARYEAAPTITSVGHATLITGTYGDTHGIVSNEWVDHATGKPTLSTEDPAYQIVGRPPGRDGTAPTWLRAATLGDSIKLADARAKVVTISAKDRASILTAGRSADVAVWFDGVSPFFTTSTFYASEIPAWVTPTNEAIAKMVKAGTFTWGLPGGGFTGQHLEPVMTAGQHEFFAERPELQPILDALEVDLAISAVKALSLGKDDAPDLLVVSFSGHDRTGHRFGPDSPEAISEYLVVDRELGRLLQTLDAEVGKNRYVVALSSDHGVAPLAEFSKAMHLDSGRIDGEALKQALEKEADTALGAGDWFGYSRSPGLYAATPTARSKLQGIAARLTAVARKQAGVHDLLPLSALLDGSRVGQFAELFRRGAFDGRTPDFVVVPRPYWMNALSDSTGHGSAYLYDRAVPLVFFGGNIKKGLAGDAEIIDVAPSLSKLLGVPAPASARGHAIDFLFR